jgi:NAD+ synthase
MTVGEVTRDDLRIDCAAESRRTAALLRGVLKRFKKRGLVLGLSGGVDSSVSAALGVEAVGAERVFGLLMPEEDASLDTTRLGRSVAERLGIRTEMVDITPILSAAGCYARRDEAVRRVIPRYEPSFKFKIALPGLVDTEQYRVFSVIAQSPDGELFKERLSPEAYRELVAAMNFKQRVRKMLEYHHADRLNYAVVGTPNRLEYDQGFFVKGGDGAADVKPIAHLYKTQVYQLADHFDLPEPVRARAPSTDTYSLPQTQEEFFFSVPYDIMDLCLYGRDRGKPPEALAQATGLTAGQVARVYADIDAKRKAARYLQAPPVTLV